MVFFLRLYTNPDRIVPPVQYIMPHVLMKNFKWQKWLDNCWCEHVILDAAVETIFFIKKLPDYPDWYWQRFNSEIEKTKNNPNVWVTIPDYPDDYTPGLTHENGLDNVDKTFLNIEKYIKMPNINWLPVIQSTFLDRHRFVESCEKMLKYNPTRVGIGTVCKTRNLPFIHYCMRTVREYFPNTWIHAFGFTLRAMPFARHYVDSADSSNHIKWAIWERRIEVGVQMTQIL